MKMKKHFKNASVLLLAFLIMSALLSSVLYIARISLRQVDQSKNVDNASIAFYAAESGNEQAVYYIRKNLINNISELNITNPVPLDDDNGSTITSGAYITRNVDDDITSINMALQKDEVFQFDMYDANNLELPSGLSSLVISWSDKCDGDSWLELTANEWAPSESGINWGDNSTVSALNHIKKSLLSSGGIQQQITSIGGSKILQKNVYQFRVKALFCDIYNLNISALGSLDANEIVVNDVIPFKNIYNIKTVGQYPGDSTKGNKQALSVSLRSIDPLSGLFDYVIFSEKSLVKDPTLEEELSQDVFYINEQSPLNITSNELMSGYEVSYLNGVSPFNWTATGLPSSINLDKKSGILSSSGPVYGTYLVNFTVTDSTTPTLQTATKMITINISR